MSSFMPYIEFMLEIKHFSQVIKESVESTGHMQAWQNDMEKDVCVLETYF